MGKSEKPRTPTHVRYPYAPVKVSQQQQLSRVRAGEAEGAGMYAAGSTVFSGREQVTRNDMKHLEFLRAFGQYYYTRASQVYASSCAFLPAACQSSLRTLETRVGSYSTPLMEGSERVLENLDCKVDSVFKMLHRSEGNTAITAKASNMNIARFEESLQYLREHGLSGLARHALRMVMSSDGAMDSSAMDQKALRDSSHQDTWSQYAMSPVVKVLETAEPGIRYTQQVYGGAHKAIISSPTYNSAVDTASEIVQRVQDSTLYKASAKRFYPAISGIADPALERLANSNYTKAFVNHLKPIPSNSQQNMPVLICATS